MGNLPLVASLIGVRVLIFVLFHIHIVIRISIFSTLRFLVLNVGDFDVVSRVAPMEGIVSHSAVLLNIHVSIVSSQESALS